MTYELRTHTVQYIVHVHTRAYYYNTDKYRGSSLSNIFYIILDALPL